MPADYDTSAIKNAINKAFDERKAKLIALADEYAQIVLKKFNSRQQDNEYWNNQTWFAYNSVFSGKIVSDGLVGMFLGHGAYYGVYLELKNDRKNEMIRPIIMEIYPEFKAKAEAIYR